MKLVFLHGPAASGKLTIARQLGAQTSLPVFHNHLIVDAVASVFPFGSERFVKLREQFWLAMFREAAEAGRSIIFTFAPEASVAPDFPEVRRSSSVSPCRLRSRNGGSAMPTGPSSASSARSSC